MQLKEHFLTRANTSLRHETIVFKLPLLSSNLIMSVTNLSTKPAKHMAATNTQMILLCIATFAFFNFGIIGSYAEKKTIQSDEDCPPRDAAECPHKVSSIEER